MSSKRVRKNFYNTVYRLLTVKCGSLMLLVLAVLFNGVANAAVNTIEVSEGVLPATTANTFTRINFQNPFAVGTTPNVFPMTTEAGNDPCIIRIRNVDHTGFEALCHEPQNEDLAHPGMTFEYIAVADGTVDVPLAGGGGNVSFQSACNDVSQQVYGPTCAGCSGAQGSQSIVFGSAFTSTPAILTQIQTARNLQPASTDPIFVNSATTNVTNTGFNVAIEQLEAGTGPLSQAEEVCYLAVARNGCQSLDFSSLGGPAIPINFNAVNGSNVDGHDNGCSSGEGATFANMCFSSTPIAIAGLRSRNGNNGALLRRCSVNANEIILTIDEDRVSNAERSHIDETVSALAFSQTLTTPVTLNQAKVSLFGRRALFEWQTSAETFHLGFHLWGELNGEWLQLNRRLIKGDGVDHAGVRDYRQTLRLTKEQSEQINNFGISSVDTTGYEEFYGPFSRDQEYGELAINEPIDWQLMRAKMAQRLTAQGYVLSNGRWRRATKQLKNRLAREEIGSHQPLLSFQVEHAGVQMIAAESILAAMPNWADQPLAQIALLLNGQAMPRHIASEDELFNAGDILYFVGRLPAGSDAIYLRSYQYQLRLDHKNALPANLFDGDPAMLATGITASNSAWFSQKLTAAHAYSAALNNGDPWYDAKLFSVGNPVSKVYSFELPPQTKTDSAATLVLTLFGGIAFAGDPQLEPDHHVQIRVNGNLTNDLRFDGVSEAKLSLDLAPGLLQHGVNSITLTLPADTGYSADIVLIDELELLSQRQLQGANGYQFAASTQDAAYQFAVTNAGSEPLIFGYQANGALSIINGARHIDGEYIFAALPISKSVQYAAAPAPELPAIENLSVSFTQDLHHNAADYVIVTHPNFIGVELDEYINYKESQGFTVQQLDWLDVVASYGFGNNTPAALNKLLELRAASHPNPTYLLLVGGHSYDYLNITGQGSINFIPTHYRPIGIFGHAPTDNAFADLDGDNLPEIAIGRWPVRSQQDLTAIINKSRSWENNLQTTQYQNALLVSQQIDSRGLNFEQQMLGRVELPLAQTGSFGSIENISMQALLEAGTPDPISTARDNILESINNGTHLLSFAGHASSAAWGFQSIVNTEFIQSLTNYKKPLIVMPLACYTTYYESPSVNTLAHQWLFAGAQGAAAIHGASVLGEYRENSVFAERIINTSRAQATLGLAILGAKRQLSSQNEMLHNWALLGDPSLPLR